MKKFCRNLLAILALSSSFAVFAADAQPTDGYTTTQFRTAAKGLLKSAGAIQPTNIVIVNESISDLHVLVPGRDQPVSSGGTGLVTHPRYAGDTDLKITDEYYNQLFDVSVCHRAILTVDGGPGNYHLNVNRQYC